ncbi:MAG: phosphoribosylglycinamide formyltransferase [Frankiales bacterium]|nr:phosphoribosylglycinamide formyltransferase [Frankiales bacterium]
MPRLAIFASGSGTTAEAVINACRTGRIAAEVVIVIGNNSAAGVFVRAAHLGVTVQHLSARTHPSPEELDRAILQTLRASGATHLVLAGYLKKVGAQTLTAFAGRVFNTHPALLPAFGGYGMFGRHVHQAVLDSGIAFTGASVHHVAADYDTGRVIAQIQVAVLATDTVDTLAARVQAAERELLIDTLADQLNEPDLAD